MYPSLRQRRYMRKCVGCAIVGAMPPVKTEVKATVFLPRDLHLQATIISKERQTSLTRYIEELVARDVEREQKRKDKSAA